MFVAWPADPAKFGNRVCLPVTDDRKPKGRMDSYTSAMKAVAVASGSSPKAPFQRRSKDAPASEEDSFGMPLREVLDGFENTIFVRLYNDLQIDNPHDAPLVE